MANKKYVVLTEGHTEPHTAKTASCLLRYCGEDVVALLDSTQAGATSHAVLGVGGDTPVVSGLDDAPGANTLVLGIAPPGGKIPSVWRAVILDAIRRGLDVIGGLHDFLTDDAEFTVAATKHGVQLTDLRKNAERDIARRRGLRDECFRVLTVGHDCSVGKMLTSLELANGLQQAGKDAHFIATGQTGILVSGEGCPIDRVVADFVSGAVEKMLLQHQHHEILMVEGQGSLVHPSYSGVTLGLMHGALPHALILCYEVGRESVTGLAGLKIPPLERIRQLNETMAGVFAPCPVIAVSMNSRLVTGDEAEVERDRVQQRLELPVCDVVRDGPERLVQAVIESYEQRAWSQAAGCCQGMKDEG
jgi:uncharacterized NAD-dependent epimerase/dehydratase family protein